MKNDSPKINVMVTKIEIVRHDKDDYTYFDINDLEDLCLQTDDFYGYRNFKIGGFIQLDYEKYKIIEISFRLDPVNSEFGLRENFKLVPENGHFNSVVTVFAQKYKD